jgi:hypothetical protein
MKVIDLVFAYVLATLLAVVCFTPPALIACKLAAPLLDEPMSDLVTASYAVFFAAWAFRASIETKITLRGD